MNEIVKIHNDLTNEKLGKMNAKELDLFMSICYKMRNKGTSKVLINFDELRKLSNFKATSNKVLAKELIRANSRLLEFQIIIVDGTKTRQRALFKEFETDEKGTVTCEVWEETAYILNNIANNFTRFELAEFVNLDSKYSKRLYKLLKQYRTQGHYYISKNDFYGSMDVPSNYTNSNFNRLVLKPALAECQKYMPSLSCEVKKKGRGGAVQGYNFVFDKEISKKNNPEMSSKKSIKKCKSVKNDFNNFPQNEYDFDKLEKELLSN